MLTLQDCIDMSDLEMAEITAIAHHEHLPDIVAIEKAQTFLYETWGEPAIRQMVMDEVRTCIESGKCADVLDALELLAQTFAAHPGGIDRRQASHH